MSALWRTTKGALLGTVISLPPLLFIRDNVCDIMPVTGASMYPFLNTDRNTTTARDVLLLWKWKPHRGVQRGMVITFWSPFDPEKTVVKRVIALPGDTVQTRSPYIWPRETVPEGHVWVEGDNVEGRETMDSNYYGPIAQSLITGQVQAVVWPVKRAGWVDWKDWRSKPGKVTEGSSVLLAEIYH